MSQESSNQENGLSIACLVLGILSILIFGGLFTGIPAVVCGIMALKRKQSQGFYITGLITGGLGILMHLIIVAILLLPLLTITTFRAMQPAQVAELPDEKIIDIIQPFIFEGILVNTSDPGSTRFIACDVAFELTNKGMAPYFLSASDGNPSSFGDEIKAKVSLLIGGRTVEQLQSIEDKESLANQIKQKVNDIFKSHFGEDIENWSIDDVYFPKFTIQ